jgi:hypothetical protein
MSAEPRHPLAGLGALPLGPRARQAINLDVHAIRQDGTTVDATLTDLSSDGCGLDCPAGLIAGETIGLSVQSRGTIFATVRWSAGSRAGLAFEEASEPAVADAPMPRNHERTEVEAEVSLRRTGKLAFRVRVYDVSPGGCRAEFVERPEVGERVWVKFDGMDPIEAAACWIVGATAGLQFVRPIHDAVFAMLVNRLRG